ncbi:MAG: hypothetical protein AB1697_01280 [Pseudomonadota bacterium]|nr:hypothetical protein [Rhodocyclaceae bacterium]
MAFERLGPIRQFGDLLAVDDSEDPARTLAAEQIAHLVEGWRYCASAFHACLVHASDNAQHFAYYAELRAALSLFSGSGIRIKQGDGFCLDERGSRCEIQKGKTHDLVWAFWPEWVKRDDAAALLRQITLLPGVSLADFEESLSVLGIDRSLYGWGYDLVQVGKDDSLARNVASYDAFWVSRPLAHMTEADFELLRELWELLLPDNDRWRFDIELIRFLVRRALLTLKRVRSKEETEDWAEDGFTDLVADDDDLNGVVHEVTSRCGADAETLRKTLTARPLDRPFRLAEEGNTGLANMLCRAVFLLRLATLSVRESMQETHGPAQIWLAHWLEHAGLRSLEAEVELVDLSDDYRLALDEIEIRSPLPQSLWKESNAHRAARLSRPEICLAWGVLA